MENQEVSGNLERFGKDKSRARMNYRQFIADENKMGSSMICNVKEKENKKGVKNKMGIKWG